MLTTLGDHLRARRLDLKLYQKDLSQFFGVNEGTINHWETNKHYPPVRFHPQIMDFLGYCPYTPAQSMAEKLKAIRVTLLGLTRKEMAKRIGVDEKTLMGWERDERQPAKRYLRTLEAILKNV